MSKRIKYILIVLMSLITLSLISLPIYAMYAAFFGSTFTEVQIGSLFLMFMLATISGFGIFSVIDIKDKS